MAATQRSRRPIGAHVGLPFGNGTDVRAATATIDMVPIMHLVDDTYAKAGLLPLPKVGK